MIHINKYCFSIIHKIKNIQKTKSHNVARLPTYQLNDYVGNITYQQGQSNLTYYQQYLHQSKSIQRAYTGKLWAQIAPGFYHCAVCNTRLFTFDKKIKKKTDGYTSFFDCVENRVRVLGDQKATFDRSNSHQNPFICQQLKRNKRCECAICGTHLGALLMNGPHPTLLRFIINSEMLKFEQLKDFEDPTIKREKKKKQYQSKKVKYI